MQNTPRGYLGNENRLENPGNYRAIQYKTILAQFSDFANSTVLQILSDILEHRRKILDRT